MQGIAINGQDGNTSPPSEIENSETCERCGTQFCPRAKTGGSPQRFCSTECRKKFNKKPELALVEQPKAQPKQESAPADSSDRFDWNDDDSVVLHHQPAVAAYINASGGLTIRQQRSWDQDEDLIIAIAPENVGEFLDKLTDVCGIPSFGGPSK